MLLDKGVARKDKRTISRVFRNNSRIRAKASVAFLKIGTEFFVSNASVKTSILDALDASAAQNVSCTSFAAAPEYRLVLLFGNN